MIKWQVYFCFVFKHFIPSKVIKLQRESEKNFRTLLHGDNKKQNLRKQKMTTDVVLQLIYSFQL